MPQGTLTERGIDMSPKKSVYDWFMDAVAASDYGSVRQCVTPSFTATLPGTGVLTLDDYIGEIERQRTAFSDLGKNIRPIDSAEQGKTLFVRYTMHVTFDGPLKSWTGAGVHGDGKSIVIAAIDHVQFSPDNKIESLTVMSDRLTTTEQMA